MEIDCVGSKSNQDVLLSRYPDLFFHLSCANTGSYSFCQDKEGKVNLSLGDWKIYSDDIEKELKTWRDSLDLFGVDILYVYGIGLGYPYFALRSWLKEKKDRVLVFLEDNLSCIDAFLQQKGSEELLQDYRVHIFYIPHTTLWESILDQCVTQFLGDRIEVTALFSYKKRYRSRFQKIRMQIMRKASVVHALMADALHYHLLVKNLAANFYQLSGSFHANNLEGICKGIPAVICGAGPSLSAAIPAIKELEQRAVVIAGGSAITALSHHHIRPHIALALDPNEDEYARLKASSSFEMPFLYSSRLHKGAFEALNVCPGYLCSDTGGCFETWMHEQIGLTSPPIGLDLGMEALSITTLAVPLARHLGCNPIILCGVDLAYTDMHRYASGIVPSSQVFLDELEKDKRVMERIVRKKDRDGNPILTLVKWIMEAACLGNYAKKYKDTTFIRASTVGLPISHMECSDVFQTVERYCTRSYDIRGLLHRGVEEARLPVIEGNIQNAFVQIKESLNRSLLLIEEMNQEIDKRWDFIEDINLPIESAKMSVIDMDLKEEIAYTALFQVSFPSYSRLLTRMYPIVNSDDAIDQRRNHLSKMEHLWKEYAKIARSYCDLMRLYH